MGRVISYGEKTGYNDGDYLLLDNGDGGTKRIRADRVGPKVGEDIINRSVNTTNAVSGKRIESNTGSISDNVNFSYVEFSVIPDDIIDYQTQRAEDGLGIAFYDSTDAFISGAQAVAGAQTLTVPTNAVKARACYRTAQVDGFHVRLCKNIEHVVSSVSNSVIQTARNIEKANDIGYPDSSKYNIIQRADINRQKRLTGYSTTTFLPTFRSDTEYFYADVSIPVNISELVVPIPSSVPNYNYIVAYTENVKAINTTYAKIVDGTSTMSAYVYLKTDGVHVRLKLLSEAGYSRLAIEGLSTDLSNFAMDCFGVSLPWSITPIPENALKKPYCGLNMFSRIQCIGDSYTQGGIKSSDGSTWLQAKKPYPQVLADYLGVTVENFGVGGSSAKSYLTNGLSSVLSATPPDLYMICFGINDCINGDTIGTIDDIKSDYSQNPDSFYGNYGRIIAQLQAHAPMARFVIFGRWLWDKSGQTFSNYASAASEIAEHFGIPFVDPFDDPFFSSYVYHYTMVNGHPTQVTYTGLSYAVMRLMNDCIETNENYYRYAGLEPFS